MVDTRNIRWNARRVETTIGTINIKYLVRNLEEGRDVINIDIINIIHGL